jgi:hypothetical protein
MTGRRRDIVGCTGVVLSDNGYTPMRKCSSEITVPRRCTVDICRVMSIRYVCMKWLYSSCEVFATSCYQ